MTCMRVNLKEVQTYFINMDADETRRLSVEQWHLELGLLPPVRVPGVYNEKYYVGLCEALYNALSLGISSGRPFIIFEDDAMPTELFRSEIEIPDNADATYLGFSDWGFTGDTSDMNNLAKSELARIKVVDSFSDVYRVSNILSCHAILYHNMEYAKKVALSMKKSFEETYQYSDISIVADGLFEENIVYATGPLFYQHDINKPVNLEATKNVNISKMLF
jgi:hypothetical protein